MIIFIGITYKHTYTLREKNKVSSKVLSLNNLKLKKKKQKNKEVMESVTSLVEPSDEISGFPVNSRFDDVPIIEVAFTIFTIHLVVCSCRV